MRDPLKVRGESNWKSDFKGKRYVDEVSIKVAQRRSISLERVNNLLESIAVAVVDALSEPCN